MPWKPEDAPSHTSAADTPKKRRQWAHAANSVLEQTGDEGRAVRAGNAAVSDKKKSLFYENLRRLLSYGRSI